MGQCVFLNDRLVARENAKLDIYDHGFMYGDGAFEGIRVYNRRIFRLDEHLTRLYRSARAMAIRIRIEREEFRQAVIETVRANELESGYVRVSISRGVGLGLDPPQMKAESTIVISTEQIRPYPAETYET